MRNLSFRIGRIFFASFACAVIATGVFVPLHTALAADPCAPGNDGALPAGCTYVPLTTIPGATVGCVPTVGQDGKLSTAHCATANPVYVIKNIYGISIGIAAILAVAMIIWAGVQYAVVESVSGHSDAKEKWTGALWGLGLLLSSYLLLKTINVDLVDINLDLGTPIKSTQGPASPLQDLIDNANASVERAQNLQRSNDERIVASQTRLTGLQSELKTAEEELTAAAAFGGIDENLQRKVDALRRSIGDEQNTITEARVSTTQGYAVGATDQLKLNIESNKNKAFASNDPQTILDMISGIEKSRNAAMNRFNELENSLADIGGTESDKAKIRNQKISATNSADQAITLIRAANDKRTASELQKSLNNAGAMLVESKRLLDAIPGTDPQLISAHKLTTEKNLIKFKEIAGSKLSCPRPVDISTTGAVTCQR